MQFNEVEVLGEIAFVFFPKKIQTDYYWKWTSSDGNLVNIDQEFKTGI